MAKSYWRRNDFIYINKKDKSKSSKLTPEQLSGIFYVGPSNTTAIRCGNVYAASDPLASNFQWELGGGDYKINNKLVAYAPSDVQICSGLVVCVDSEYVSSYNKLKQIIFPSMPFASDSEFKIIDCLGFLPHSTNQNRNAKLFTTSNSPELNWHLQSLTGTWTDGASIARSFKYNIIPDAYSGLMELLNSSTGKGYYFLIQFKSYTVRNAFTDDDFLQLMKLCCINLGATGTVDNIIRVNLP